MKFLKVHKRDIAIALVLFVLAALPRLLDLGEFLTADEKNWIGRSYEFIRAFKDLRFNDMLQTTHPGVTTLWLVGGAVTAKMFISHVPFSFQNLVHFVPATQFAVALVNSLAIPMAYLFLRQLFPGRAFLPVLATSLIALDPFVIGYSRVAHVDALLMSFLFPAALATVLYAVKGFQRRWLLMSAILSGLAFLTKIPAVFMVPYFCLVVLVFRPDILKTKRELVARTRDFVIWLLIIGLMFVIVWPAMVWVPDPEGNVLTLKRDIGRAAITPHHMSEDYTLDGVHYPLTLLIRTTPVVLVFSGLAVLWLLLKLKGFNFQAKDELQVSQGQRRVLWLLVAYVFFFVVMMTLGAKKGDRYILPVFPALDVLAAFGVWGVGSLIKNWKFEIRHLRLGLRHVLGLGVVVYLTATVWYYHPYAIAYSNPLFPDDLSQELGWGEGLEQVGAWLSLNDPKAVVASWYPEELGAYTSAHVAHINAHEQGQVRYIVLYRNMFGRALDHPANNFIDEYYKKREPVFVAEVVGKPFAWVYSKWSYERVVGELTPGMRVGQEVVVGEGDLAGLDVLVATYSGRAQSGELVINLRQSLGGLIIHSWRVPVRSIEDDIWLTLELPEAKVTGIEGRNIFVEVYAEGTRSDDAPTVRYTRDYEYRPTEMLVSSAGELTPSAAKRGDLAIRFRYRVGSQTATEEETRLLGQ